MYEQFCERIIIRFSSYKQKTCRIFIDILVKAFDNIVNALNYLIPDDITIAGVLDLNQLNPIFNSFPVLTRNYASLYLQLWTQDFLQDLKVVYLNKSDTYINAHLAYQMLPPEKSDIIYLHITAGSAHKSFSVRIVNMYGKRPIERRPQNSIRQIKDAIFTKLDIKSVTRFITFAMNQYPTRMFSELFQMLNLVICQRNITPQEYVSLNPMVTGQMFEFFVEQDLVSVSSDLYHSLNFQNRTINESGVDYYGHMGNNFQERENIFYNSMLYSGSKAVKIYYPHKFMLAWKMATDDSFMRGYNASKMGARTNIQFTLQGNLTTGIVDTDLIKFIPDENQNNLMQFVATRAFPTPTNVLITLQMHYLCESIVRFSYYDASDPQVLSFEIVGEIGGAMIRSG
ncbi:MAG: hypothetical protein EZS28_033909 [Streblomastix strix]|uniref:Uncharacterized protein n=1 Tax=Streblomastix strix TaxID=222440 RepID=A0A5J4UK00_9EUKA|nr:MAG: hypothetical protein EZS28_033909 [Streblomastix strix]